MAKLISSEISGTLHVSGASILSGNALIYGTASLSHNPTAAYILYNPMPVDKITIFPGLEISGGLNVEGGLNVSGITSGTAASFTDVDVNILNANTVSASTVDATIISASVASASLFVGPGIGPGGTNTTIQFNSGSTFSGSSNFAWDYTSNILNINGSLKSVGSANSLQFWKDSTPTRAINIGMTVPGSSVTNDLTIATYEDGPGWAERVRVTNAGNVGIGVTNPSKKLEVNGTLGVSGDTTLSTVSGTTAQFTTISGSVISASSYVGLTAGNVTGSGTASKIAYWTGTNSIGEISEIAYLPPSPGNGSRINWNNSGQGITLNMSTNTANSSIILQSDGAVEIYQNANSFLGGSRGINFNGNISTPAKIQGSSGLELRTVTNPFVTSELTITHEVPGLIRTLMKTSYNAGVVINPDGNNDVLFRVQGSGSTSLLLADSSTNRVAINKITTPNATLDVNGNTIISGNLTVTGSIFVSGSSIYGQVAELTSSTTNYTLVRQDSGKFLNINSGSAVTVTVPTGLPTGFTVSLCQLGAGQVTVSGAVGVTINNRLGYTKTAGQYAVVSLVGTSADTYVFVGDTAA